VFPSRAGFQPIVTQRWRNTVISFDLKTCSRSWVTGKALSSVAGVESNAITRSVAFVIGVEGASQRANGGAVTSVSKEWYSPALSGYSLGISISWSSCLRLALILSLCLNVGLSYALPLLAGHSSKVTSIANNKLTN
jgi:hypothetical protein